MTLQLYEDALECCEMALKLKKDNENDENCLLMKAQALANLFRFDESRAILAKLSNRDPEIRNVDQLEK